MLTQGPSGADLPEDQCIFVRGYRVTRAFKLFPRLRGAAGHNPDPSGHDSGLELEVVSLPSFTKYKDPLHVLSEYIAERAPGCDFVLVHDDDLGRIRGIGDGTSPGSLQPDAVMGYLQKTEPEIAQVACDSLSSKNDISKTGAGDWMVAALAEESRSWVPCEPIRVGPSRGPPPILPAGLPADLGLSLAQRAKPSLILSKRDNQRKFIDLINQATFKWANWDPQRVIQIGDFGTVDKKTGEFKVEGNIFTHPEIEHIAQSYPPFEAPETDLYQIHSGQVRRLDIQADPGTSGGATEDQGLVHKSRWQFNAKRGAILLMHRPRLTCVPDGFLVEGLDLPILKRKVVAEQVYNCPGFYMYLSNKASEQVTVSLHTKTSTPPVIGASSNQALTVGWSADGATGVCLQAYRADATYTPLFRFKSLGRRNWWR
ncbi:hypothetical protein EDB85DRAFT_840328 [Lactarius pseudohatsudake]|nr:hypothetical protein EDB85DRAFT_840328 [Lactarius pseudohatsudake]